MKKYNWYIIREKNFGDNNLYIVQYYGREKGFECMVCEHGNNAFGFNRYYDYDQYESWFYGKEHMPEIVKDLGSSEEQIIDNKENLKKYLEG